MVNYKFKIGDLVCVVDEGLQYTTYSVFFIDNMLSINLASRYAYGVELPYELLKNVGAKVVCVGTHRDHKDTVIYGITRADIADKYSYGAIYLVEEEGLSKKNKRYTVSVNATLDVDIEAEDDNDAANQASELIRTALQGVSSSCVCVLPNVLRAKDGGRDE